VGLGLGLGCNTSRDDGKVDWVASKSMNVGRSFEAAKVMVILLGLEVKFF